MFFLKNQEDTESCNMLDKGLKYVWKKIIQPEVFNKYEFLSNLCKFQASKSVS